MRLAAAVRASWRSRWVWRFLLDPDAGPIDNLLRLAGITGPNWLGGPSTALPSLIVMAIWRNFGFQMVVFLAGLQGIPAHLYEAAWLDGAGRWQQLRYVTLPMLRPTPLFGAVITGIGYLQFFEEPFVMTQGGPLSSTLSVSYHIYDQSGPTAPPAGSATRRRDTRSGSWATGTSHDRLHRAARSRTGQRHRGRGPEGHDKEG